MFDLRALNAITILNKTVISDDLVVYEWEHWSREYSRQVVVRSRFREPISMSTAVGEGSRHLSTTTRLIQSRSKNRALMGRTGRQIRHKLVYVRRVRSFA